MAGRRWSSEEREEGEGKEEAAGHVPRTWRLSEGKDGCLGCGEVKPSSRQREMKEKGESGLWIWREALARGPAVKTR